MGTTVAKRTQASPAFDCRHCSPAGGPSDTPIVGGDCPVNRAQAASGDERVIPLPPNI